MVWRVNGGHVHAAIATRPPAGRQVDNASPPVGSDLYFGFNILNTPDPKNLDKCDPERTIAVVSTTQSPTGQMASDRHMQFLVLGGLIGGIGLLPSKTGT
jgi:hypothetical protein